MFNQVVDDRDVNFIKVVRGEIKVRRVKNQAQGQVRFG
jgi:hypothetical protein